MLGLLRIAAVPFGPPLTLDSPVVASAAPILMPYRRPQEHGGHEQAATMTSSLPLGRLLRLPGLLFVLLSFCTRSLAFFSPSSPPESLASPPRAPRPHWRQRLVALTMMRGMYVHSRQQGEMGPNGPKAGFLRSVPDPTCLWWDCPLDRSRSWRRAPSAPGAVARR